jgi:transposase-like protein
MSNQLQCTSSTAGLPESLRYPAVASIPSEHEMNVYHVMSKQAVESKMYRGIGDQAGVMMIMLAARELGIPPMQALNGGLNIIQGKVEISARMMNALIRKSGHHMSVKESTDTSCTIHGRRNDNSDTLTVSYTLAEAQKAGLVKPGGGWVKNPKDMCFARALSRLARQLFSDVIGIGYVEGEIKAIEGDKISAVLPQEDQTIVVENENEWLDKFLSVFEEIDKNQAEEYLKIVQTHFEWTKVDAIKELLKDKKKLFEKFSAWKNKIKKTEEG